MYSKDRVCWTETSVKWGAGSGWYVTSEAYFVNIAPFNFLVDFFSTSTPFQDHTARCRILVLLEEGCIEFADLTEKVHLLELAPLRFHSEIVC